MSTRLSLRRSRRAPKKLSGYHVGDLVEVTRNNVTMKARLAQPLTEGSAAHPRWLVKFEGPYKDEEVYEHLFGKVLEKGPGSVAASDVGDIPEVMDAATHLSETSTTSTFAPDTLVGGGNSVPPQPSTSGRGIKGASKKANPSTTAGSSIDLSSATSNDNIMIPETNIGAQSNGMSDDVTMNSKENAKSTSLATQSSSPLGSEESSTPGDVSGAGGPISGRGGKRGRGKGVTAREERSRRRQAAIDVYPSIPPSSNSNGGGVINGSNVALNNKRKQNHNGSNTHGKSQISVSGQAKSINTTSGLNSSSIGHPNIIKRARTNSSHADSEECVKIKFLTGTLFLYRGRNRRAEFLRRV